MAKAKTNTKDLERKLVILVSVIVIIMGGMAVSAILYAPQIGSLFGLVSKHRNDGPPSIVSVTPPTFINIPEATKEEKITLQGYAQPTSTIKLFVNGPIKETVVADLEGKFLFTDIKLINGKNTIYAKAVGEDNVESEKSDTLIIKVDKEEPKIEEISPSEGDSIKNLNNRILVQGKLSESAKVKVNDKIATVKPDNTFEILLGVKEGNVTIKIEVTDLAGNTVEKEFNVTYQRKSN